jgi:hypothetical protein
LFGQYQDGDMFRTLAALAIAASIDLYVFDGRYTTALWQMAIMLRQHI